MQKHEENIKRAYNSITDHVFHSSITTVHAFVKAQEANKRFHDEQKRHNHTVSLEKPHIYIYIYVITNYALRPK